MATATLLQLLCVLAFFVLKAIAARSAVLGEHGFWQKLIAANALALCHPGFLAAFSVYLLISFGHALLAVAVIAILVCGGTRKIGVWFFGLAPWAVFHGEVGPFATLGKLKQHVRKQLFLGRAVPG